ncbi:MAG: radical SAM protein [Candidatus Gastranaerophilales bacterium]|nr:radical SAM protein [Candidatus Gastranaerophilales bacterium]
MTKQKQETYLYKPSEKLSDSIKIWMSFPASYNIGMSALGYLSMCKIFDTNPKANMERYFFDTEKTSHNVKDVELFGFSFSFEFDFINIFKMLEKLKIPLYAKDRDETHPLLFAGGPVMTANPEPFAEFFDFIIVGDGENSNDIIDLIYENRTLTKAQKLEQLSNIKGIYVPSKYQIEYNDDFSIKSITPDEKVIKNTIENLDCVYSPIVTPNTMFSSNCLVEIARGCPQKCAFCWASYGNLPFRYPSYEQIIDAIEQGIKNAGKIGLLGALVSAHPEFDKITDYINDRLDEENFDVSISSLRADRLNPKIVQMLVKAGQKSSTIAIEAGSQRLRDFINKKLTREQIFESVKIASENGLTGLKMYTMIGLPTETMEDIKELVTLAKELQQKYRKISITISSTSFVPKAHTPFQWYGRENIKSLEEKNDYLKKHLHMSGIKYRPTSIKWDHIQGLISRGDRRISKLLIEFCRNSASLGSINRAYKECSEIDRNLPPFEWYANRDILFDEILPWDMIEYEIPKASLLKELNRLQDALHTSSGI